MLTTAENLSQWHPQPHSPPEEDPARAPQENPDPNPAGPTNREPEELGTGPARKPTLPTLRRDNRPATQ